MYCSNCGKQLNEDGKFCPNCGQKNLSVNTKNNTVVPSTHIKPIEKVGAIKTVLPKGLGPRWRFLFGKITSKPQFLYITKGVEMWLIIMAIGGGILGFVFHDGPTIVLNLIAIVPYLLLRNALRHDEDTRTPLVVTLAWSIIACVAVLYVSGSLKTPAVFVSYWVIRLLGALDRGIMKRSGSPTSLSDNSVIYPQKETRNTVKEHQPEQNEKKFSALYIIASTLLVIGFGFWVFQSAPKQTTEPASTGIDLSKYLLENRVSPTPAPTSVLSSGHLTKVTPIPNSTPSLVPATGTFLAGYFIVSGKQYGYSSNLYITTSKACNPVGSYYLPGVSMVMSGNGIYIGSEPNKCDNAHGLPNYRLDGLIPGQNYSLSIKLPIGWSLDYVANEPGAQGAFNGSLPYWNPGMTNGGTVNIHFQGENSLWIYIKQNK